MSDPAHKHVAGFLWQKFRTGLALHFRGGEPILYGPFDLESSASIIAAVSPDVFWRITREIVRLGEGERLAEIAADVIESFPQLDDERLKRALAQQWNNLPEFLVILSTQLSQG